MEVPPPLTGAANDDDDDDLFSPVGLRFLHDPDLSVI
jgi:hypothetical protein